MYKAIILEDDISISLEYEILLKKLRIRLIGIYKSWKEVSTVISKSKPDFIILDLFLANNENGIEFLEKFHTSFIPTIVVTGYPEKLGVTNAVSYNISAFLKKPIDSTELEFAIQKIISSIEDEGNDSYIIIKEKGSQIKVPQRSIVKILIEGNYSTIVLDSAKRFVLKSSLKNVLDRLDENKFFRCHRSTVVNFKYVIKFDSIQNKIVLSTDEELSVGVRYRSQVRKLFSI